MREPTIPNFTKLFTAASKGLGTLESIAFCLDNGMVIPREAISTSCEEVRELINEATGINLVTPDSDLTKKVIKSLLKAKSEEEEDEIIKEATKEMIEEAKSRK